MKKTGYKFSVVIPAKNESEIISKTIDKLEKTLTQKHEVIVIDDLSSDKTYQAVTMLLAKYRNLRILKTTKANHGFGSALKLGISKSTAEYVVIVMADLCDDPKTINKMYSLIVKGYDIVCGSRYVPGGSKTGGPVLQGMLSKLVCKSLKILGIPTYDISNAFKMYRKSKLQAVLFDSRSGVEASMQISLQAFFNGAKFIDIPTVWKGRTVGQSKFKFFKRLPKYWKIYSWAINNIFRKKLNLPLTEYNVGIN